MKTRFISAAVLILFIIGCSKSNNKEKPKISIKSVTTVVPEQGTFEAILSFTQKNGKLSGGTFIAVRQRLNQKPTPPEDQISDSTIQTIPDFPNKNNGEFDFQLPYAFIYEDIKQNDTIAFKFLVIDTNSDTSVAVTSGKIVVLQ